MRLLVPVFLVLLLSSGCSSGGEPSEDDLRGLLEYGASQLKKESRGVAYMRIDSLEKVGCSPAGPDRYSCRVKLSGKTRVPPAPEMDLPAERVMEVYKSESGWALVGAPPPVSG